MKNVVFDIGQVLIKFEWKEFLCELFSDNIAASVYKATWENPAWRELDLAIKPFNEIVGEFIKSAPKYKLYIETAIKRMGECARNQPYSIDLIKELKADGLKVFYLSNYFEYLKNSNQDVLDFIPSMDGGIFSYEVHCVKPDTRIFKYLCDKYEINAYESVFVDDNKANIDAALKLGFKTVWFKGQESLPDIFRAVK